MYYDECICMAENMTKLEPNTTLWKLPQIDFKRRNKIIIKMEDKQWMGYQRVMVNGLCGEWFIK
jgi:hypothetical protein